MSDESRPPEGADEPLEHGPEAQGTDAGTAGDEEELRRLADEHWNKYLRAVAEMENLRKRGARDLEHAHKYGAERLAAAMLPVRDSIEAGLKAATGVDRGALEVESLLEGERATLRLLDQALEAAGVREIDPLGEPFDPTEHEAMSMLPSDSAAPGSVLEVIQKGYALHERIMRPARVIVAREAQEDGGE